MLQGFPKALQFHDYENQNTVENISVYKINNKIKYQFQLLTFAVM
jgi:hypothetical protein